MALEPPENASWACGKRGEERRQNRQNPCFLKIIPTKDLVVYTLYMILYKMFYENFDIKATLEKHIN